jgi:hypothetical protein
MSLSQGSGAGGSPGGNNGEVQVRVDGTTFGGATNVKAGSGYWSVGVNPADVGSGRFANDTAIFFRNFLNNGNIQLCYVDTSNNVIVGSNSNPADLYLKTGSARGNYYQADNHYFQNASASVTRMQLSGGSGDFAALGAIPATTGNLRLPNVSSALFRDGSNISDLPLWNTSGASVTLGHQTTVGGYNIFANTVQLWGTASAGIVNTDGSGYAFYVDSSMVHMGRSLAGYAGGTVPFRFKSVAVTLAGSDVTLSAAQYECPIVRVTGTSGNIIAPNIADSFFFARNTTDAAVMLKKSGGVGTRLAPRKAAIVAHDGTDYINLCPTPALVAGHRLTLSSGNPVPTSDTSTATIIYLTPYEHSTIALIDPASLLWVSIDTDEISVSLGTLVSGKNYDVFAYINGSGAVALEIGPAWTNDTTRATALVRVDGVLVKSGDFAKRYVGTFRTVSTTQTTDTLSQRYVWNYYNRRPRRFLIEAGASWSYASSAWRQPNGNAAMKVELVCGDVADVEANIGMLASQATNASHAGVGVGIDSVTVDSAKNCGVVMDPGEFNMVACQLAITPLAAGYHYLAWLEHSENATTTFYGESNVGAGTKMRDASMSGTVWG